MDVVRESIRLGLRALCRAPGLTATAALTLALGIGPATAVFTTSNAPLVRRLRAVGQYRIVVLAREALGRGVDDVPLSLENARNSRDGAERSRARRSWPARWRSRSSSSPPPGCSLAA